MSYKFCLEIAVVSPTDEGCWKFVLTLAREADDYPQVLPVIESQRGSVSKPRVARNELPWVGAIIE
jgi:hypothetical protein